MRPPPRLPGSGDAHVTAGADAKKVRGEQGPVTDREVAAISHASSTSPNAGASGGLGIGELAAWHLLDSVKGLGPRAAYAVHTAGLKPDRLLADPGLYPLKESGLIPSSEESGH